MTRGVLSVAVTAACLPVGVVWSRTASPQSQPASPTAVIIGRVVDGVSGTPLTGALVTLSGTGLLPKRVIVDPQGRFLFHELPAGGFTITASKTGYLPGSYGTLRPDGIGRRLELGEGERVLDATLKMWRYATVSGRVTDDAGDPVPARVQAWRRAILAGRWRLINTGLGANADERGMYRITGLTPGEYSLVITSMTSALPSSLLQLADAVKRMPQSEAAATQMQLFTNGTGGYLSDLMQGFPVSRAGDLLMQTSGNAVVGADGVTVETYPTIWYPAAPTPAEASLVSIGPGDNREGIDLRPTLTRTMRVSGTVIGPDGPVAHMALRLVPAGAAEAAAEITSSLALSLTTAMAASDANGAFTFLAVPPGQYIVRALTTPRAPVEPASVSVIESGGMRTAVSGGPALPPLVPTEPTLWAAVPVTVGDKDTTGVVVTLQPGLRVTGSVEFVGTTPRPAGTQLRAIRVSMDPADGRSVAYSTAYQAQIDANGRFYSIGLIAGRYLLRLERPPPGWTLKSAMLNGRDICDTAVTLDNSDMDGLVLTFTDRTSTLSGRVRNAQGSADEDATVLVFPGDGNWTDLGSSPRRLRSVRVSRTGAFSIAGLPAGDYFLIAVSDSIVANWQEPAFLQRLARSASRVTLTDGQSLAHDLSTTGGIVR